MALSDVMKPDPTFLEYLRGLVDDNLEAIVDEKISTLVDGAPEALDKLNELAAAMGDDPNFAATMLTDLALKQNVDSLFVNVKDHAATGDGITNDRPAFVTVEGLSDADVYVPPGTYKFNTSTTFSKRYRFAKGAILKPAAGVTLTFAGTFDAGLHQIFDRSLGGSIAITPGTMPIVYPEWFGAVGDNATDDLVGITGAISAAGINGVILFLRRYVTSGGFTPLAGQKFLGVKGYSMITVKTGGTFNVFVIGNSKSDVVFDGLIIDGNAANVTGGSDTVGIGLYFAPTTNGGTGFIVRDTIVRNCRSHGIRVAGVAGLTSPTEILIENVQTTGNGVFGSGDGIIAVNATKVIVVGKQGSANSNYRNGIIITRGSGHRVVDIEANDNGNHGVTIQYSTDWKVRGVTACRNGVSSANASAGGIVAGGGNVGDIVNARFTISDCTVLDNYGHGIDVDPTITGFAGVPQTQRCIIANNLVSGSVSHSGIYMQNVDRATLIGNRVFGCAEYGIYYNGTEGFIDGNVSSANNMGVYIAAGPIRFGSNHITGNTTSDYNGAVSHRKFGRFTGAGSPLGALGADVGSTYQRTDGGTGTTFYVKESGTDGTGWVALPSFSTFEVRKTVDEVVDNNTTTLHDIADMSFAVGANETWRFRFVLVFTGGATGATADCKVACVFPAGATVFAIVDGPGTGATVNTAINATQKSMSVSGSGVVVGGLDTLSFYVIIEGNIINGATAGTFKLQAAQSTAQAVDLTAKVNSFGYGKRTA